MLPFVHKYYTLLRIWISRILVYRVRILIYFIIDGLHFLVFPFIWLTVYAGRDTIGDFSKADIVTYYLVLGLISTLATAHGGERLRVEIIKGEINQNLVRPLHQLWYRVCHDVSYHIILFIASIGMFTFIRFIASQYVRLPENFLTYFYFAIALIFSYILSTCLQFIVGMAAFWFGEVSGLRQMRHMTEMVFSGEIAPLAFFPSIITTIGTFLPFSFMIYVPAQIFLEKIQGIEVLYALGSSAAWCTALIAITVVLWNRGLRRYEGVGI